MNTRIPVYLLLGLLLLPLAAGCTDAEPGGAASTSGWFWIGLSSFITLVVGFLVGATATRSGNLRLGHHRHRHHRRTEAGWSRVRQRIRDGISQGLADWRSTGNAERPDWGEIGRRIEERIIEEMHKHHD